MLPKMKMMDCHFHKLVFLPRTMKVLLPMVMLLATICRDGEGVEVFRFQPDGVARLDTQAVYKGSLDVNKRMSQFTFCGRVKLFFLHGRGTYFQLRNDVEDNEHMLKGQLFVDRVRVVINMRWQFQPLREKLRTMRWYHLCFTYDQENTLYSTYLDGVKVYELVYDVGRPIYGDYARLGQTGSLFNRGNGSLVNSFSGEVSQVNIWDYLLPPSEIKAMAACENDKQGTYISWNVGWTPENVETYDINLQQFCEQNNKPIMFGFPKLFDFEAYYICRSLGTNLPLPVTKEDLSRYQKLIEENWSNETHCLVRNWTPLNDEEREGHWVQSSDNRNITVVPWSDGEPNGMWYENCGFIGQNGIIDDDCDINPRCATCELTSLPVFRLVGICERELRKVYFVVHQEKLGEIILRGYSDYIIEFINDRWVWYNRKNNQTMAKLNVPGITVPHYPMGRRSWELFSPVCGQQEGVRTLLLTHCEETEYTCDDGTCISLSFRCDHKYDCLDNSDEHLCDNVIFPENYAKEIAPRAQNAALKELPTVIGTFIRSIEVDPVTTRMSIAFELQQSWSDARLQYVNLKPNSNLNKVSINQMTKLWSPKVNFVNTPDNQHTSADVESSMVIHRVRGHTRRDLSVPAEMDLYPGGSNPCTVSRLYSAIFECDFDLALYPFDAQNCFMRMNMESASSKHIYFDVPNSTIALRGPRSLVEFEVDNLTVQPGDSGEFSEILFGIKLVRRYGFAMITIYMPSIVMLTIGYITLFFRTTMFGVRVMSALTTLLLLVGITIFTQVVSGSLPKTSSIKLVDIWLVFCIWLNFFIIIFHIVIDTQLHKQISPRLTKLEPIKKEEEDCNLDEGYLRRLIIGSKVVVLTVFTMFNFFYWGYIVFLI